MKTFKVLLHLENTAGIQCDYVTTYLADTWDSVEAMIQSDYGDILLYWEEA